MSSELNTCCPICRREWRLPENWQLVRCACGFVVSREIGRHLGLGDLVAAALYRVGLSPERYMAVKAAVGLKRRCRCPKRQRQLNELGNKAAAVLAKVGQVLG